MGDSLDNLDEAGGWNFLWIASSGQLCHFCPISHFQLAGRVSLFDVFPAIDLVELHHLRNLLLDSGIRVLTALAAIIVRTLIVHSAKKFNFRCQAFERASWAFHRLSWRYEDWSI